MNAENDARLHARQDSLADDNPTTFDDSESEDEDDGNDYDSKTFTVLVLGKSDVGKSSLLFQFANNSNYFPAQHHPTILDKFQLQRYVVGALQRVTFLDWGGEADYPTSRREAIADADGFVFVYSITDRSSLEAISELVEEVRVTKAKAYFPCVLVANKSDCDKQRAVPDTEGKSLAKSLQCPFFKTSAKTHDNVDNTFQTALERMVTFTQADFSGYLVKKGGGRSAFGRKNWKKRWFCLEGACLTYKKSYKSKKVLGRIEIPTIKAVIVTNNDDNKFEIVCPTRTFIIHAKDVHVKREWVTKLQTLVVNK
ncbi:hypothetical protein PTSG_03591 [Salpingoeca rosetta]|uniref:PH domain-containing protein n=1 Tax=Salpingoeca rosetta (strain ATCC 50818 / BSB-021) TaxID=946362 RepID=F2U615_SALR5|nr:uncharacterized protein PTSG_03591 [Salpingoeca rosetta]EGD82956.1 hypothetical protein PTSG_03591 [Salpingoeca rosetta]|eukprot:XP_004995320.1 hypothetical protein PTSG_03591 [Salpingoeca rosetta]